VNEFKLSATTRRLTYTLTYIHTYRAAAAELWLLMLYVSLLWYGQPGGQPAANSPGAVYPGLHGCACWMTDGNVVEFSVQHQVHS